MKTTDYTGIDYGNGKTNTDTATGIRFGVISRNAPFNCAERFYDHAQDLTFQEYQADIKRNLWESVSDLFPERKKEEITDALFSAIEDEVNEQYQPDNPALRYERDGYVIETCLDNDLIVIRSPFYTHAQFCSPCVPGAGNLETFCESGPKTYCLGHDWFDGGKAPYLVYSVETGNQVNGE